MLSDPITLNTEDYTLRSIVDDKSIRGVAGLTAGTQKLLTVFHDQQGSASKLSARRGVRFDYTKPDGNGELRTLSVYLIGVVPEDGTFSAADVSAQINNVVDFFEEATNGAIRTAAWLAGEP